MKTFSKILTLLDARDRIRALVVLGLFLLMSFLEVLGIASILPFITILSNPDAVQTNTWLKWAYDFLGFNNTNSFLFFCGFGVLGILIANNGVKALTRWTTIYETQRWGERLSCRLLSVYLGQPYHFFLYKNSSEISKNILAEVHIATQNIILSTLEGISKTVVSISILALLMLVDPLLALSAIGGMGVLYGLIFFLLRKILLKNASHRTQANSTKFKIVNEALQGIKNIKLSGYEPVYQKHFNLPANQYALSTARSGVIAEMPHFFVEVIAFGGILLITLYLMSQNTGGLDQVLPTIVLYSFAGYRLMPGMQGIYASLSKIRFHAPVLDILVQELGRASTMQPALQKNLLPLDFQKNLEMRSIGFSYENKSKQILNDVNFQIHPHDIVGIIGKTGAGKTTLVDLLLGLLDPSKGQILVDGVPLTPDNQKAWQKNLSYVSQHIYLCDDTVRANIAFGIPADQILEDQVCRAARMADLADFIETELPHGYDTIIGENGIRLSGGQRQRLGLARALYLNRPVLVLDEATSALDPETEKNVMQAIYALGHDRTILMISHKPELLNQCDYILKVHDGTVEKIKFGISHDQNDQNNVDGILDSRLMKSPIS